MNIILDMDGTIIDNYSLMQETIIIARPYLREFLHYLFSHHERISIWTNGSSRWYNKCFNECIQHHMPQDKSFDFVITYDDCLVRNKTTCPKSLSLIYDKYSNYSEHNTIMIDDSPHTLKDNMDNGILISSYEYEEDDHDLDNELLKMINIITAISNSKSIIVDDYIIIN